MQKLFLLAIILVSTLHLHGENSTWHISKRRHISDLHGLYVLIMDKRKEEEKEKKKLADFKNSGKLNFCLLIKI